MLGHVVSDKAWGPASFTARWSRIWGRILPIVEYRNFQTHSPDGATGTAYVIPIVIAVMCSVGIGTLSHSIRISLNYFGLGQ